MLTIDASVFVASIQTHETHYADSRLFLNAVGQTRTGDFCPSLLIAEYAASISRRTGDMARARQTIAQVQAFPNLSLISVTFARAQRAAELAAMYRLRGADAVYVAVAEEFGTILVTWDGEMHERGANAVITRTPVEWLASQRP